MTASFTQNYIKQIKRQIELPVYHTKQHTYNIRSMECLLTHIAKFQCLVASDTIHVFCLFVCNVIACVQVSKCTFHSFNCVYTKWSYIHIARVNFVYIAIGMDSSTDSRVWMIGLIFIPVWLLSWRAFCVGSIIPFHSFVWSLCIKPLYFLFGSFLFFLVFRLFISFFFIVSISSESQRVNGLPAVDLYNND